MFLLEVILRAARDVDSCNARLGKRLSHGRSDAVAGSRDENRFVSKFITEFDRRYAVVGLEMGSLEEPECHVCW